MIRYITRNIHQRGKKGGIYLSYKPLEISENIKEINKEKELFHKVLETTPSKKEAMSFINRFLPQGNTKITYPIALIALAVPLSKKDLNKVIRNIAYIHRLGLHPIITLENLNWYQDIEKSEPFNKFMIQDGLSLCELIESQNISTRFISNGAFISTPPLITEFSHLPQIECKVEIDPILSALRNNSIPVLLPISSNSQSKSYTISIHDSMAALSRCFSRYKEKEALVNEKEVEVHKVIVINTEGGIPNLKDESKRANFINLQQDLEGYLKKDNLFSNWKKSLLLVNSCLAFLPYKSSAVVLDSKAVDSVLDNIITDKPLVSPSLPNLDYDKNVTMIRYGIKVKEYDSLEEVNIEKLKELLEKSFNKKVKDEYFQKLRSKKFKIIIAGDFLGAIITTQEDDFFYLDKFAVSVDSQGIGVSDLLWKQLTELSKEIVWRCRTNNAVTKWYFQRSSGNIKLNNTQWSIFWTGKMPLNKIVNVSNSIEKIPSAFF